MKPGGVAAALRLLLAGAAFPLAACATSGTTFDGVVLRPVFGEEARVLEWMESARKSGSERRSMRALADLKLESPSGGGSVREVIVAERPARLRLETLNLLGQTQAVLVTDGERFSFFEGGDIEEGPVAEGLLWDRLGIDLEPEQAVRVLLADPHLASAPPRAVYAWDQQRVAEFPGQRVRFSPTGDVLSVEALDESGAVRWAAEYGRWRDVDGGRYPFIMFLRFPRSRVSAEIELDEVDLNPALEPALFTLRSSNPR
ncbi:MAG: hypothetical protein JRG76_10830 [Deltaproteobacteria bacterium]|nr:hypothetical protein [Deltaproteobacteria bacterium]